MESPWLKRRQQFTVESRKQTLLTFRLSTFDFRLLNGAESHPAGRRWALRAAKILAIFLAAVTVLGPAKAQEERKRKVPGLDKVTGGSSHLAFSGKIQSLDLQQNVLNVNTVQGHGTEIFPIKKGVHIATADGKKLKLDALIPGTDVIVYYEQKGDRRTVKKIDVLAPGAVEGKKPPPRS